MGTSHLYVIGKRGLGVLFVRTAPLRVAMVSDETILKYEEAHPGVDGYAKVAASAKALLASRDGQPEGAIDQAQRAGIEALVAGGAVISDVDFSFLGEVTDSGWTINRMVNSPLEGALAALGPDAPASGDLFDAILSDSPNSAV
ncbi:MULTISPECIES: hypothetical protein [Rhizobium]|uniref:Uncharacterized protein n=1 Tax=Rhizobium straminoryzae TaxID=1387186 RepID=A0A549SRL7_9HYPH|nr:MULTISPECIES: hypothetical protein [Rhizobium]MBT9371095.1 hypothetical protein [Rhizobium sp. CSW-27]TRL32270.1 hypothetical protein FNA46_23695 [Rhizobium straminoryzae]SIQ52660.1 hypothetical protein SAMN05880590_10510 [Rhizobium sp. RU35A]